MGRLFGLPEGVLGGLLGVPGDFFGCLWESLGSSWATSGGLWEARGLLFGVPRVLLEVFLALWKGFGRFLEIRKAFPWFFFQFFLKGPSTTFLPFFIHLKSFKNF